jgi:hypothetical protein
VGDALPSRSHPLVDPGRVAEMTWRVDAVVDDPTGRPYLKLSRRTGRSTEFRFIAPAGFGILSPRRLEGTDA